MSRAVIIKRRATKVDTIDIDSCLDETHTLTNTVTDHPVEKGSNITDHSRPDPDTVTLRCFVSNTPLSESQQKTASNATPAIPGFSGIIAQGRVQRTSNIGAIDGRGEDAYKKLLKLRNDGSLITVVTTLRTYTKSSTQGMMITSITIPRTTKNYDGIEFSITLKQVRIVTNRSTQQQRPEDKRAGEKEKKGSKTAKKADDDIDPARKIGKAIGAL